MSRSIISATRQAQIGIKVLWYAQIVYGTFGDEQ
jgi:hypothetical protein